MARHKDSYAHRHGWGHVTSTVVRTACALLLVTGTATGCKASFSIGGENKLPKSEVEKRTADLLAAKMNQPVPTVTCPGDLAYKVGATLDCTLTAQGDSRMLPVHLEVDSVDSNGTDAHFKISVGDTFIGEETATTTP